jgi:hypothetical protein
MYVSTETEGSSVNVPLLATLDYNKQLNQIHMLHKPTHFFDLMVTAFSGPTTLKGKGKGHPI